MRSPTSSMFNLIAYIAAAAATTLGCDVNAYVNYVGFEFDAAATLALIPCSTAFVAEFEYANALNIYIFL
jgi:hypothetical protein